MKSTDIQEEQYEKMTGTPVSSLIVSLAVPTIISMLVTTIYNMADTYFVGTLGTSASGATGIIFGLMAILQAFGFMFGHGAGSNISRQLGARHPEEARRYSATSFWLSILVGLVIMGLGLLCMDPLMRLLGSTDTILPYARIYGFYILIAGPAMTSGCVLNNILRYEGKAVYAMFGLTAGGLLNIAGDAVLIRSLGMGMHGAGISTAVSQYISVGILLLPYLQGKTQSRLSLKYLTLKKRHVLNIVRVGFPSLMRQGLNSVSTMMLNQCAGVYGDPAVAAISITARIMNFLLCVAIGLGQGLQPVSAFNYGAGKYSRVRDAVIFSVKFGTCLMLVLGVLGFSFAEPFVRFFRDDPAVIEIGKAALRIQCVCLPLMPMGIFGNMLFQSIGKSEMATFLAALRSGVLLIPSVWILTALFRLRGLECAQACAELGTALITLPIMVSFMKNLPEDK